MRELSNSNHVLQIYGPRNAVWRPANDELFRAAQALCCAGNAHDALVAAQDAYIKAYGNMHDVAFRVVSTSVRISYFGSFSDTKFSET